MLERMWRKGNPCALVHSHQCKIVQPLWKTVWKFLKKLEIELPYDPAVSLLGMYMEKTKPLIQKDTHTQMFIALFTIAKTWKQPKSINRQLTQKM